MGNSDDVRLINANELKEEAYRRFGLESIKLITLIDEMPTVKGDKNNGRTHDTRIEDTPGVTP